VRDFSQTRVLERLLVYERRIEGSLYRTMGELRKLQGQRKSAGGVPGTGEEEAVRDTHPTDLTLGNLLAGIAALEETPASVTTNGPADPACETNPIGRGSEGSPLRHRDPRDDPEPVTETALTPCTQSLCGEDSRETNPICVGPGEGQSPCSTGVRSDPAPSCLGETRPILDEVSSLKGQVASGTCKTNPIPAGPVAETPHHSTIPSFHDSNVRPQAGGQSCKTNPICGGNNRQGGYRPIFRRRR
jgi:hypothetical protein